MLYLFDDWMIVYGEVESFRGHRTRLQAGR